MGADRTSSQLTLIWTAADFKCFQERRDPSDADKKRVDHRIAARLESAHGVFDVNSVVWCPRDGLEDVFGTAGDDGHVKIWKVVKDQTE